MVLPGTTPSVANGIVYLICETAPGSNTWPAPAILFHCGAPTPVYCQSWLPPPPSTQVPIQNSAAWAGLPIAMLRVHGLASFVGGSAFGNCVPPPPGAVSMKKLYLPQSVGAPMLPLMVSVSCRFTASFVASTCKRS